MLRIIIFNNLSIPDHAQVSGIHIPLPGFKRKNPISKNGSRIIRIMTKILGGRIQTFGIQVMPPSENQKVRFAVPRVRSAALSNVSGQKVRPHDEKKKSNQNPINKACHTGYNHPGDCSVYQGDIIIIGQSAMITNIMSQFGDAIISTPWRRIIAGRWDIAYHQAIPLSQQRILLGLRAIAKLYFS
jgi:hypothetical protein